MDCIENFKNQACEYYRDHIYNAPLSYKAIDDFADKLISMIPPNLKHAEISYCVRWVDDLLKLT